MLAAMPHSSSQALFATLRRHAAQAACRLSALHSTGESSPGAKHKGGGLRKAHLLQQLAGFRDGLQGGNLDRLLHLRMNAVAASLPNPLSDPPPRTRKACPGAGRRGCGCHGWTLATPQQVASK